MACRVCINWIDFTVRPLPPLADRDQGTSPMPGRASCSARGRPRWPMPSAGLLLRRRRRGQAMLGAAAAPPAVPTPSAAWPTCCPPRRRRWSRIKGLGRPSAPNCSRGGGDSAALAGAATAAGVFTARRFPSTLPALHLAAKGAEVFAVLFLDAQHRLLRCDEMFRGTLTQTSVYPRGWCAARWQRRRRRAAHNHPLGRGRASRTDEFSPDAPGALALVDVRVLDHLVVGRGEVVSLAERGLDRAAGEASAWPTWAGCVAADRRAPAEAGRARPTKGRQREAERPSPELLARGRPGSGLGPSARRPGRTGGSHPPPLAQRALDERPVMRGRGPTSWTRSPTAHRRPGCRFAARHRAGRGGAPAADRWSIRTSSTCYGLPARDGPAGARRIPAPSPGNRLALRARGARQGPQLARPRAGAQKNRCTTGWCRRTEVIAFTQAARAQDGGHGALIVLLWRRPTESPRAGHCMPGRFASSAFAGPHRVDAVRAQPTYCASSPAVWAKPGPAGGETTAPRRARHCLLRARQPLVAFAAGDEKRQIAGRAASIRRSAARSAAARPSIPRNQCSLSHRTVQRARVRRHLPARRRPAPESIRS